MKIGKLATEASTEASATTKAKKTKAGKAEQDARSEKSGPAGRGKNPGMTSMILEPKQIPKLKQFCLDFQVHHGQFVTISAVLRAVIEAILATDKEIVSKCANEAELRRYFVEKLKG